LECKAGYLKTVFLIWQTTSPLTEAAQSFGLEGRS
jgi:hypothetical protein